MPPGSHSSSSHSSGGFSGGSHSSFHSSPSFHSSSSHSSYSSSYSSSSYSSSHSSSSHSSDYDSSGHSKPAYKPVNKPVERTVDSAENKRKLYHQRHTDDWNTIRTIMIYHYLFCDSNDRQSKTRYRYYPHGYTDKTDYYNKPGYYNEVTGKRYDNIIMPGVENVVTCPHCQKQFFHKWGDSDTSPSTVDCPFCDEHITVRDIEKDEFLKSSETYTPEEKKKLRKETMVSVIPKVLGALVIISVLFAAGYGIYKWIWWAGTHPVETQINQNVPYQEPAVATAKVSSQKTLYVEPLGREVPYDGENYYDKETDSYFWFNTDVNPAQWQYWFEGISSQYGDYGWMEFDSNEQQWYVETYSGNWVKYEGDTSKMWHFEDAYQSPESMKQVTTVSNVQNVTVQDTVYYSGLDPNQTYTVVVTIVDKNTNEPITDVPITIQPEEPEGTVTVDLSVPEGREYTTLERISKPED